MGADPRLYVALDLPSTQQALEMVEILDDDICAYKIGLQLLPVGGMELAQVLKARGKAVFLDYKLHDIGATVQKAVASIAPMGADMLTVHATPDVMSAAVKARAEHSLKIMAVTVLTSLDDHALRKIGFAMSAEELVLHRVKQAVEAGVDGVIASPLEACKIRALVPDGFLITTPGVRMSDGDKGDQKRVSTPRQAFKNGASHIVIGRPITQASDPKAAVGAILDNIRAG